MNVHLILIIVAAVLSLGTTINLLLSGTSSPLITLAATSAAGICALVSAVFFLRSSRKARAGVPAFEAARNEENGTLAASARIRELESLVSLAQSHLEKTEIVLSGLANQVFPDCLVLLPLADAIIKAVPGKTEEAAFSLMEKFLVVREASGRASASARTLRTEIEDTSSVKSINFTAENSRKTVRDERAAIRELFLCTKENQEHLQAMSREIETGLTLLNSITEITERSKLIAFNMSIEAARMGEKGRGVKVITTELHKLNDRTFDFSRQVATLLARFKDYNTLLVRNMEEKASVVVSQVERGIDAAEAAVESLISASSHTEAFTKEIALMSEDINRGLDGVLESLQFQDITRQMIEGGLAVLTELKANVDRSLSENDVPVDRNAVRERFIAKKQRLIAEAKTKGEKNALMEVQL